MSYASDSEQQIPTVITPLSRLSLGTSLEHMINAVPADAAWPVAKKIFYIPFMLPRHYVVQQFFTTNGATITGGNQFDIGIYNSDGVLLGSTGATNRSGTNVVQRKSVTAFSLGPGEYYMAMFNSDNSSTMFRYAPLLRYMPIMGLLEETTAGTALPATMTPVTAASLYIPVFGFTSLTGAT